MPAARFTVECPAYVAGPFPSRESAQRNLDVTDALGACMYAHEIKEFPDAQQATSREPAPDGAG